MGSTKFEIWNPHVTWVKIGNVYAVLSCHRVAPEDDCGYVLFTGAGYKPNKGASG